jgi:outer membrane biosynthesis protein TonB
MKTSAVLASLLFGSFAVAAPVDKRALVYKTEVVTETVVVYTTVFDDDEAVAQATTTPAGYFYEAPKAPSSAAAQPTPEAPVNTPAAVEKPSSTYVAPAPQAPTPTPSPSPAPVVEAPKPVVEPPKPVVESPTPVVEAPKPVIETPQPAPTSAYIAPAPVVPSAAPAPAPSAPVYGAPSTGAQHSNVDMTIYDNNGGFGACGTELHDSDMIVALAASTWGASTYDVMTGAATNPWCGQKIKIDYNGNSIEATIMDLCPGCSGADIDLSLAAWKKLTGLEEKTRLKASWSKIG